MNRVITAGIDIGASTSKAAILEDNQILSYIIIPTGAESASSAQRAMDEALGKANHLSLEDMGKLSLQAKEEIRINSTCTVFGKSEVASLIRQGSDKQDILAGLHAAILNRVYTLLRKVGVKPDFAITGGIAKNIGIVRKLEERVGLNALLPEEPQMVGALGAALIAHDKAAKS